MKKTENMGSSELRDFSNRAYKDLLRNTGLGGVTLGEASRMVGPRAPRADLQLTLYLQADRW